MINNELEDGLGLISDYCFEEKIYDKVSIKKRKFIPIKMKRVGLNNMAPREFLIDRFDIEKQSVICLCGSSNAGKTIFAQYLALCVSANKPIFDVFPINNSTKLKKVLHLDFEQALNQSQRRYERIATFMGLGEFEIDRIKLPKLDDPEIPKEEMKKDLEELFVGYDFVVIDSLRQATICDENDSRISGVLELIKHLAEFANTVVLLVHHKGKNPNQNNKDQGRGSSAIYAGVDIQIDLDCDEGSNVIKLTCKKNREQIYFNSLTYNFEDEGEFNSNQRCSEALRMNLINSNIKKDNRQKKIMDFISENKHGNFTTLYNLIKGDKDKFKEFIGDMIQQKLIKEEISGKSRLFSVGDNAINYGE